MLCDLNSTFGSGLSLATTGIKGDVIDLGCDYNIGAGANKPPCLIITSDTAITGANGVIELWASSSSQAISGGTVTATKLMTIPAPAQGANEIVFSGELPYSPEASGRYLVLNVGTASTSGTVTAQIVYNPPVHHIYSDVA